MTDIEKPPFFELVEAQVTSMGGSVKRGVVTKTELEEAREIRVSIRLPRHIGSTELFTLRNISPGDYHLLLIAIPRRDNKTNP
jgi:ethanolamine utilization protein EutP (predicted NTPase)